MPATESRWPPQVSGAQKSDSPPSPPLQQDCHCHTFQPPVENHKTEPPQKYSFQLGQCFSGSKKPSLCSTDNFLRGKIFPKFWPIKISFNKMLSAHHLSILQTHLLPPPPQIEKPMVQKKRKGTSPIVQMVLVTLIGNHLTFPIWKQVNLDQHTDYWPASLTRSIKGTLPQSGKGLKPPLLR